MLKLDRIEERKPTPRNPLIPVVGLLLLAVFSLGAVSSYEWGYLDGEGTPANARKLAFQGDQVRRLQAFRIMYEDALSSVETFKEVLETSDLQGRTQAELFLGHLREALED